MKKSLLLLNLGMAAALSLTFAACSSEESEQIVNNDMAIKPAKTPDFVAYSGSNIWGSTRATDVSVNGNYFKIVDFGGGKSDWMRDNYPVLYQYFDNAPQKTDRDEQVSQAEYEYVIDYIKNHPDEGGYTCDLTTYFIQNVGSSKDVYTVEYIDEGGNVHHTQDVVGGDKMDYLIIGDYHINDYNAVWGQRALCVDIPVVSPSYHDSYGTEENTKENAYKFYYIEYEGKVNCYLCFDYRTKKYDNGQCDYEGDGVYNDWVIKLTPADGSSVTIPTDDPDDPDTPVVDPENEVEVNLSVNDEKEPEVGDYIATKLSIHVRANTDVEVFIPVPAQYYCDADDMNIVLSHRLEVEAHGPLTQTMAYDINGHEVTLTASFEADGIRITTQGMSQDILDYTRATYNDGVTFEVWNYFKDNITRAELKTYLDQATVTFTSATEPKWYVNAFANLEGDKNPWDCIVTPSDEYQKDAENTGDPNYNVIYEKE